MNHDEQEAARTACASAGQRRRLRPAWHRLPAVHVALIASIALLVCACAGRSGGERPPSRGMAPVRELGVPGRVVKGEGFELLIPAGMPPVQQEGTFYYTVGPAAQVGPQFAELQEVEVGISVYHSPEKEFQRRTSVREWAEHPLPSGSTFRRATMAQPRIEPVSVPRAAEAAVSISEHEGIEPLGTGGHKSLSMRLFVKPRQGNDGWVISAHADGPATNEQLRPGSDLAQLLERSLRSFRLSGTERRAAKATNRQPAP